MNGLAPRLGIGPFAQLLGQAAVVGVGTVAIGQIFFVHQAFHAGIHAIQIDAPAREQVFQAAAFLGRFGMQGKMHPLRFNVEIPLQFFNTPGTEITPRSNVIGEYFQYGRFCHCCFLHCRAGSGSVLSIAASAAA